MSEQNNPDNKWRLANVILGSLFSAAFGIMLGEVIHHVKNRKRKKKK